MSSRHARLLMPLGVLLACASFRCNAVLDIGGNEPNAGLIDRCDGPEGRCKPGKICNNECKACFCDENQTWSCSPTCPGSECPAVRPMDRSPCPTAGAYCPYANTCSGQDYLLCADGAWHTFRGTCPPPPKCPFSPPVPGSACTEKISNCMWKNWCGVWYSGSCDGSTWVINQPVCVPGGCPYGPPVDGSTCDIEAQECQWYNLCHTYDYASCVSGQWTVASTCKPVSCPTTPPTSGDPCERENLTCSWKACAGGSSAWARCTKSFSKLKWVYTVPCK